MQDLGFSLYGFGFGARVLSILFRVLDLSQGLRSVVKGVGCRIPVVQSRTLQQLQGLGFGA